jgi:glycerate-2-kinase
MKTPSQPLWAVAPDAPLDARGALIQLYWAAIRSAAPGPALRAALDKMPPEQNRRRIWIISIGKAANPMATAAVEWLGEHRADPVGGVIVAPRQVPAPHPRLEMIVGDHPQPGVRSLTAAKMIEQVASRVQPEDEAWVLLSGGTTSLIAAPDAALKPDEMMQLFALLHRSGLDIATMNLIRKRFTRWGAGRLAAALRCSKIRNFVISDVIGDDLAAIGSGPCVPDPSTAAQVRSILVAYKIWDSVPTTLRRYLHAVERDPGLETPKAGDAVFENVERKIIASNRTALDAIVAKAKEYGYDPRIMSTTLSGDAASAGRRVASTLTGTCGSATPAVAERAGRSCLIWGGETTVSLGTAPHGDGGRCQELALAAARELAQTKSARGSTILACGTDGRDGDTDAAGAVVNRETWNDIMRAGRDPEHDLAAHDAYHALDAAGALLRTDLTATNVMDVVIGVCGPPTAEMMKPKTPSTLERISGSFRRITE